MPRRLGALPALARQTGKRHQLRVHITNAPDRCWATVLPASQAQARRVEDYAESVALVARDVFRRSVTGEQRRFESRLELSWP